MNKVMAGIDLHSNNLVIGIIDMDGKRVASQKLSCKLKEVVAFLSPCKKRLEQVAVESTYNWYWLVDGLKELRYPVVLANPAGMEQYFFFSSRRRHTRSVSAFLLNRSSDLCSSKIITSILSFISGRLATKSNQIKQLIRNGRSASLQRTFKKSFTSFSHSTRNKTRDGLIRVRNIRALNGRFNTSITHAY